MFNVLWKEANIGELSDVSNDMWYIEGEWTTNDTELALEFRMALQDYNPKKMLEVPHNAQKVVFIF